MMRTPSPPPRMHTPPAPLHGGEFDSWVPFSPRRSGRVAAQRDDNSSRLLAPTGAKSLTNRASLQGLSPPASPVSSPYKRPSPRTSRRAHFDSTNIESDSDNVTNRFLSEPSASRGMLPTPAKTPRKRALQTEESLQSTARILFANRTSIIEDAMPTPRKNRKSNLDLFSLDDQLPEEKIEVYTDSKDRVPTADEADDNPFITRKGKGKARGRPTKASKSSKAEPEVAMMQNAVDRGEGMIYLFRGKKIFRKFDDEPSQESDQPVFSGDDLRKQAGSEAHRPLTRAYMKPRLLFQEEIKKQRENDEDDEEAVTDIEYPIATPSRKGRKTTDLGSPSKQQEASPPPTISAKRQLSFESWSRVKSVKRSAGESSHGKKRASDTPDDSPRKRVKSEQTSSQSAI